MRPFVFGILLLFVVLVSIARAADITYDLSTTNTAEPGVDTKEKIATPFSIEVKDRVWVYEGIEEATEPAKKRRVVKGAAQRIRYETSPGGTHVSYLVDFSEPAMGAPDWIDDELWPRTKEVLHYTNEPRSLPRVPETVLFLDRPVITTKCFRPTSKAHFGD